MEGVPAEKERNMQGEIWGKGRADEKGSKRGKGRVWGWGGLNG